MRLLKYALLAVSAAILLASAWFGVKLAERHVTDSVLREDAEKITHHWADHIVARHGLDSRAFHDRSPEHDFRMHQTPGASPAHGQHAGSAAAGGGEAGARPGGSGITDAEMRGFHSDRHLTTIEGWALYSPAGAVVASGGKFDGRGPSSADADTGRAKNLATVLKAPDAKWTTTDPDGRSRVFISLIANGAPAGAIRVDLNQVHTRAVIARSLDELAAITAVIVIALTGIGLAAFWTTRRGRARARAEISRREAALIEQNERFNVALENMSQGLCMFDAGKRLVVCNDRYIEMYGLPRELAEPGTPFRSIIEHRIKTGIYAGDNPESYVQERLDAIDEGAPSTKIHELTNGRVVAIAHRPMPSGGWVATHEDITELQRVQGQVAHMALHDALTNLPNRLLLRERIEQVLPAAKRGQGFAVLCLDLDRFKSINDTLGHPIGDELLIAVAERLSGCIRETDTIARLGGDEFAVIQVSPNQPHDSTVLAARICELIKKPFELKEHQVVVDVSIGIAVAPGDGADADSLLKNADMALYRAKSDGRGVYRFFEADMDARMQARRRLELDLRKALENDEFELYYQPLVNLESDEISGFEALLRWHHPERGLVPPTEFIPIAEDIGLIVPLGEWVIRTACAQAAAWPANVTVAVNLSPVQFRSDNLVPTVFSALAKAGVAAGRLELEITETVLLNDAASTLKTLHQLRDLGVRIAMDDFGTGYSSLSYLRSFPFDKIKIDGSFVSDLSMEDGPNAIVDAVASLSRSLGMTTTAEGVETPEQLQMVRNAGYTEMQGFLFSPPRSAADIMRLYYPATGGAPAAKARA